ncbi:MAG TPA: transposase [Clostridiaceae bacterium]|nr:transposase [Clostridiaceae bacterium]
MSNSDIDKTTRLKKENEGRYGYKRITFELKPSGYTINHKTVLKFMIECNIGSLVMISRYKSYKGEVRK